MAELTRISRRRVMQLGILAPLVAMNRRGAGAEERSAAAISLAGIPDDALSYIKEQARKRAEEQGYTYDEDQFTTVASILWMSFTRGVREGGKQLPTDSTALAKLIMAAYDTTTNVPGLGTPRSGDLIADCVNLWTELSDSNLPKQEPVTQYCAFLCGINAATLAGSDGIDDTVYGRAFNVTKNQMAPRLDKARCLKPRPSSSGDDKLRFLGAGC